MASSSLKPCSDDGEHLRSLLDSALPFLRGELERVDPRLPSLAAVLRSGGAGECWHKNLTFLHHHLNTHRILRLWKSQESVSLLGLFHSAYSKPYMSLAIFDPSTSRETVAGHVGDAAERLIHLFSVVPRRSLIHDDLLSHYSDSELTDHLKAATERGLSGGEEPWRKKLARLLPADGVVVKHVMTGEDLRVSRRLVAVFILMNMADFSDQMFGFHDVLFENSNGRLEFEGNDVISGLWPGDGKPGLWMNSVSRMGAVYRLIAREEEILRFDEGDDSAARDGFLELVIPPVFENCTKVLDSEAQIAARDLYWEAVSGRGGSGGAEGLLVRSVEKNPFVGEPRVVLGQVYLGQGRFEEAEREAAIGLRLMLEWASPWDKRMSWEGWVAWARVLLLKSKEKSWPQTAWGILNLGLVN